MVFWTFLAVILSLSALSFAIIHQTTADKIPVKPEPIVDQETMYPPGGNSS
jgi:hypothetical protein